MLFVTGAVQIPCKKITRQLFLRTDLPDPAKHGGAGASGRGLYSELHKDRSDRWFTWKLRISNRLWLHPKGYHEKNHYFFLKKEEAGKVTQKKILLKSMRALEFQCPLKFRCQTRDVNTSKRKMQGFRLRILQKLQQTLCGVLGLTELDGTILIETGSLTPPSSKNLSKRCKRLIFLSIS